MDDGEPLVLCTAITPVSIAQRSTPSMLFAPLRPRMRAAFGHGRRLRAAREWLLRDGQEPRVPVAYSDS